MAGDMTAARAKVHCPECGREIGRNNLVRHRRTHGVESSNGTRGRAKGQTLSTESRKRFASNNQRSRAVGRYLDDLESRSDERANGKRRMKGVSLGALKGFPAHSTDPDQIDAAADQIEATAQDASSVRALRLLQRVIDLRESAIALRETGGIDVLERDFIAVAAQWAADNGIGYAAFRAMGVPASVLKDAGVSIS